MTLHAFRNIHCSLAVVQPTLAPSTSAELFASTADSSVLILGGIANHARHLSPASVPGAAFPKPLILQLSNRQPMRLASNYLTFNNIIIDASNDF